MGYAWTKRHELGGLNGAFSLKNARDEFKKAADDYGSEKATRALEKLQRSTRQDGTQIVRAGMVLIVSLAVLTFVLAQIDFFLVTARAHRLASAIYGLLTFGALLFIVVGLFLPEILKLRVGSIELEKSAASEQTSAGLGIQRVGSYSAVEMFPKQGARRQRSRDVHSLAQPRIVQDSFRSASSEVDLAQSEP
jgi:hypothetical protein